MTEQQLIDSACGLCDLLGRLGFSGEESVQVCGAALAFAISRLPAAEHYPAVEQHIRALTHGFIASPEGRLN